MKGEVTTARNRAPYYCIKSKGVESITGAEVLWASVVLASGE